VSTETASREVFRRLPNGSYEVFEELAGRESSHSFLVSSTVIKVTDTIPFDAVPAEMQVTKKNRVRCNIIIHRDMMSSPPCRAEPSCFSEYVTQQPHHVRRIIRECDLSETATQKVLVLICSPGSFSRGTDGGLLNGLAWYFWLCMGWSYSGR
jgi:hypothetical protein